MPKVYSVVTNTPGCVPVNPEFDVAYYPTTPQGWREAYMDAKDLLVWLCAEADYEVLLEFSIPSMMFETGDRYACWRLRHLGEETFSQVIEISAVILPQAEYDDWQRGGR